jgi:L-threonylcarbamoyladenylate synthase
VTTVRTRVLRVHPHRPEPEIVAQAAAVIRRGGLVAFPTETVYGLGANALDGRAVARIFAAKGRPAHDPLIVHVAGPSDLPRLTDRVPEVARRLAALFWPGPLTLVLGRAEAVPAVVAAGRETVAVRCPDHPVALALIRASGTPIAAPSANRFGRLSPTTARHVLEELGGRFDLLLDGGPTPVGVESTVLDPMRPTPTILRPGGVTREELEEVLGRVAVLQGPERPAPAPTSPGLLMSHYAPRAKTWLIVGPGEQVLDRMRVRARELAETGSRVGALVAEEDVPALSGEPMVVQSVGPAGDLEAVARNLFAALRALDAQGVDVILARDFGSAGLGLAIRDRLTRAAAGRVERVGGGTYA